nr:hypothetical protein [uncultured bacterium]
MFKVVAWVIAFALCSGGAWAASSAARLSQAHAKLKEGDAAGAMELLRELQVESPGDEHVLYALGCAQYKLAEGQQGAGAGSPAGDAAAGFKQAEASFDGLRDASDPEIAKQSSFDRANCLAQAAKSDLQDPAKAKDAEQALRGAAMAYEEHLRRYPGDKGAEQNRDHVRYLLKKMQREKKDNQDQNEKKDEQKKDQEQRKALLSVRNPQTELPGAKAVIGGEGTVQLVKPGTPGGNP